MQPILLISSAFAFSLYFFVFCFLPPAVCPSTSCSLPSRWTWVGSSTSSSLQAPPDSEPMTQSTAKHAEGGTTGAHSELCHCPPEQTESWRRREKGGGVGGGTGRDIRNQLVREGWQSDSQCTITLVFRFGPSEHSFWTHLCLLLFFFLSFFAWSFGQWKHIPVMPHCCSLFRFLITNSITRMGCRWPVHKPGRGQGPGSCTVSSREMKGLSHGGTNPKSHVLTFYIHCV